MRSILLLPLVARCLETIDICMWRMFVFVCCSDCVGVCGNVCCVAAVGKDSVFSLEVLFLLRPIIDTLNISDYIIYMDAIGANCMPNTILGVVMHVVII